jgi:hypothetical protein
MAKEEGPNDKNGLQNIIEKTKYQATRTPRQI